jgi:hypothetical protein
MNYKALTALGIGLFFGTTCARERPNFSIWVMAFAAILMLVGIFGSVARKPKKQSN